MKQGYQTRRLNTIYRFLGDNLKNYDVKLFDSYISVKNITTGEGWYSDDLQWIKRKLYKDIRKNGFDQNNVVHVKVV